MQILTSLLLLPLLPPPTPPPPHSDDDDVLHGSKINRVLERMLAAAEREKDRSERELDIVRQRFAVAADRLTSLEQRNIARTRFTEQMSLDERVESKTNVDLEVHLKSYASASEDNSRSDSMGRSQTQSGAGDSSSRSSFLDVPFEQLVKSSVDDLVALGDESLTQVQSLTDKFLQNLRGAQEKCLKIRSEELERKKLENSELSVCCICRDAPKTILLLPCRHLCICESCSRIPAMNQKCPVCRCTVSETLKVYST